MSPLTLLKTNVAAVIHGVTGAMMSLKVGRGLDPSVNWIEID